MAVSGTNQETMPEEEAGQGHKRCGSKQEQDDEEQEDDEVDAELDEEEAARQEARRLRTAIADATEAREELQQRNTKWVLCCYG
ncbi:unnamed protein product [Phytophthora lilii]|uniref:Unnamed protein product n=1 Tax=Phytophthora lilii TaxID=2077276 RepID=A0A9W6WQT3_9STRA|nr:unnamed protein product [Phytophthora lilii]